ncbi:coat protein [ssRNA phage SRR7976325_24]|uniref:Coat protein n=1 Tax=ssRNA phage SRR7976325_24 TaxID=2786712 RepID=A0A8S5L5H7_9VIRU|nr:coat protein [ssRNA phage SRR7976325_24]DAD52748.1 TPA_asm: coat protein [ssRNA phage SRR7976325_24]
MFADPQSVTVNAVAKSLARVTSTNPRQGRFSNNHGEFELVISQNQTNTRFRREFRLNQTKIAVDPISTLNKSATASVVIVVDEPKGRAFTPTELGYLIAGIKTAFDSTASGKLLEGEI